MLTGRRLILLSTRLVVTLIIATSLFALLIPRYTWLVAQAADRLAGILEHPRRTKIMAQGDHALVSTFSSEGETPISRYNYELYFDGLLFVALLLATPKLSLLKRLKFIVIGAGLIMGLHVVNLTVGARRDVTGQGWWLATFLIFARPAFAVLLWALLTLRYWFPWPIVVSSKKDLPKPNDPCFCGSGKKYKYCCGK